MTRVAVVLTTFNGASRGFLGHAIQSVLDQTYEDFELLIVDDGSTDDTSAFCQQFSSDSRVRYIRKENGGVASARNVGITESRGELVCFLDDDDEWLPGKLSRQVELYDSEFPRPGLVYTAIEVIDAAGHPLFIQAHRPGPHFYRGLFFENSVDSPSSTMVPRKVIDVVGGFREEVFGTGSGCEDREMWIRIARQFSVVSVAHPLVRYRLHGSKMSGAHDNMEKAELTMLELSISEGTSEIKAERSAIIGNAYRRFAHNRFTLGHYQVFRRHFGDAGKFGRRGPGLWFRYLLSFVPLVLNPVRTMLGRPAAGGRA